MAIENRESRVLAVANSYQQKFFLNPLYDNLPLYVKQEIREMAIRFTEEAGGILELSFDEQGHLQLIVHLAENDLLYDEIGGELLIKEFQREKEELFSQLELYYGSQNML